MKKAASLTILIPFYW